MIKTIADAYEALKGDLKNIPNSFPDDKYLYFNNHRKGCKYLTLEGTDHGAEWQYICTVEEFNNFKPESKMIKLDVKRALTGDKVIMRGDGREVTQLVVFKTNSGDVLYGLDVENDRIEQWLIDGRYHDVEGECASDLFMAPKQLSGFINYYSRGCPTNHDDLVDAIQSSERLWQSKGDTIARIDLSQFPEGYGL